MQSIPRFLIIFGLLCLLPFLSCTHDGLYDALGTSGDFTQSNIKVIQIDTFSVKMSTFRYDSIASSTDSRLLVGRYNDPYFGTVKSTAYANFVPSQYYVDSDAVFDSIVLNLEYDGFYYNDTLSTKTINIHQLTKTLRYKSTQDGFYNTSSIAASDEIIGTKSFVPYISKDSVTVRLNDSFGYNLFYKIQHNDINDADELNDYFKGLKISPGDTEDASLIGFNVSKCYLRFYYSFDEDTTDDESQYYDFTYYSTTTPKFFNHIESDRAGTLLSALGGTEDELPSTATNNLSFVQSGTGITTKVMFPSLRNIYTVNDDNGEVYKANLKIKLNKAYYDKKRYVSDSVYVYIVDQNNAIVSQLTDDAGNSAVAYIDKTDIENNEVYLVAPVTTFIKRSLLYSQYLKYGLVFFPKGYNSRAERMVLNGENNSNYKSRLQLTYTIYDE